MSQAVEDALNEWDEKSRYKPIKGRVYRRTIANSKTSPSPTKPLRNAGAPAVRARIQKMARRIPEVMVKVSGGGRGMRHIKAHLDYISRNGDVGLENEEGQIIMGREAVHDLREEWKNGLYGIPDEGTRREAFNIVLSMPPGTDRKAVSDAARDFARTEFGSNHHYVFASHDDEAHPHVHLCVKALGMDGTRLNPRKADLQRWRELFAESLELNGVQANATPRRVRGVQRAGLSQKQWHLRANGDSSLSRQTPDKSAKAAIEPEIAAYGRLAKALAAGGAEDRHLAIAITEIVKSMPTMQERGNYSEDKLRKEARQSVKARTEKSDLGTER